MSQNIKQEKVLKDSNQILDEYVKTKQRQFNKNTSKKNLTKTENSNKRKFKRLYSIQNLNQMYKNKSKSKKNLNEISKNLEKAKLEKKNNFKDNNKKYVTSTKIIFENYKPFQTNNPRKETITNKYTTFKQHNTNVIKKNNNTKDNYLISNFRKKTITPSQKNIYFKNNQIQKTKAKTIHPSHSKSMSIHDDFLKKNYILDTEENIYQGNYKFL